VRGPDGLDAGSDHEDEGRLAQSGIPHLDGGGPDFDRMIEALRLVQERITAASPPDEVVAADLRPAGEARRDAGAV
jgi:hypothetical protein